MYEEVKAREICETNASFFCSIQQGKEAASY